MRGSGRGLAGELVSMWAASGEGELGWALCIRVGW